MQANTSQGPSSQGLEDLDKIPESSITQINDEYQAITNRSKYIADRQDAITYKNGGANTKPSDIIHLNVRGTELFARRGGSLYRSLGKTDIDPVIFKKILEYLYMVKISEDVSPLPTVDEPLKDMFEFYIKILNLRGNDGNLSTVTI